MWWIGDVAKAFNAFMDKLHPLMTDIRASANTVEAAAQELDQQTSQASHKMDGHCLETDKVVAAVTEMSATAREVASNTYSTAQAIESANSQIAVAQKEVNLAIDGLVSWSTK